MDYGTFLFTTIVSVAVYAVSITLLALHNRRLTGLSWLAGGILVNLVKLILQSLEGKVPPVFSALPGNELYLVSYMMQFMGLRWFVVRKPMTGRWPWIGIGILLALYTAMFLLKVPYSSNVTNLPCAAVMGASAWILFKHGRGPFTTVSRVSAVIVCGQTGVAVYRALLTNLLYMRPWETFHAQTDPRWLYSMTAASLLVVFMVMCDLWFVVTELNRELAEQASTDPLTGALNRRAMDEAAQREAARSIRHGHPLCAILIDIDHFKLLNDTRAHAAGDCALKTLVCQIRMLLRCQDLLARMGGDEFAILLPDTSAPAGIAAAERVRLAVEALEIPFDAGPIRLTVSAGVAQLDPAQGGWETMLQRADVALYDAKQHGRNSVAARLPEHAL